MLDVQADIHRPNYFQSNSYMSQYQTDAAFSDLALWSNPAWLNTARCLLSAAAATEWVVYHRTCIDQKKVTVLQLMGSVRGVIPNSKLAKYGDYRYNMDHEDMYRVTEDITAEWDKNNESISVRRHFRSNISKQDNNNSLFQHEENEEELKRTKRWLKKVKNALDAVRIITNEEQLLDSNAIALLKLCLRFIYAASINDSLINTMKSEITFIIDYEQHRKIPISMLELQSIPQPGGQTTCSSNYAIDFLWLKLASKEIRQLWKDDTETSFPYDATNAVKNPLTHLMKMNFLRCSQQTNKGLEAQNLDIPKSVQVELLGSLLDVLEGTSLPSNTTPNNAGDAPKSFSEAYGIYSKRLSVPIKELNQLLGKEASFQCGTIPGNTNLKVENKNLSPRTFYKCVPPPTLAPVMRGPPSTFRSPSYMYCQNRNNNVMMPANISNLRHMTPQAVRFVVPKLPVTYMPSSKYVPSSAPPPIWSNFFLQRLNATIQASTSAQYSRMTAPPLFNQQHSSKDVTEDQKPKTNEQNSISEKASQQNIVENKVSNDNHWSINKSVVQPTHYEFNSSTRIYQNRGYLFRNCNVPQPIMYNRYLQRVASSICGVNSICQLPVLDESVVQAKGLHPLMEHRLSSQLMHPAVPRNQLTTQFALNPTMGTPTVNGIKQVQERMILEKYNHSEMNKQLQQPIGVNHGNHPLNEKAGNLSYEEKVENWLLTVNKYMKSGSCLDTKDLLETCQLEIPGDKKFCEHRKEDSVELRESQNTPSTHNVLRAIQSEYNKEKPFQFHNLDANKKHIQKNKIGSDRASLIKPLELCGKYGIQLKKGKTLESKVKILKKFFAEIDLEFNYPVNLKCKIKNLKLRKQMLKNKIVSHPKKQKKSELKQRDCRELIKSKTPQLTSENYFDLQKNNIFPNDACHSKVLIRESYAYNAFPSKRMKITNSEFSFVDDELLLKKERDKVASLNHLEKVIDELFFGKNQVGNTNEGSKNQSAELEMLNGWAHFKITVKSVLKDIISSLQNQNFQR